MRKFVAAVGVAVGLFAGAGVANAQSVHTLEFRTAPCVEDMPCWRAWMEDGQVGPSAPAYMFLPEGALFDALAPLFGYRAD